MLGLKEIINLYVFMIKNRYKEKYTCIICNYQGPFVDLKHITGVRKHAKCPKCGSLERHRLRKLVLDELSKHYDFSKIKMLHIAPEPFFRKHFEMIFREYISVDLTMKNVDFKADIRNLPFGDAEYDFVYGSHVLEHIKEDLIAISEIRRILKPKGIAILPVPIVAEKTIEYLKFNQYESRHVRAPGFDYYNRICKYFSQVKKYSSKDFPPKYQTFIYENRNNWPNKYMPFRKPMIGEKHIDLVPVCFV